LRKISIIELFLAFIGISQYFYLQALTQQKVEPRIGLTDLFSRFATREVRFANEDSESGVASAVSAGLTCYAIPGLNTAMQSYRSANRMLTDFTELD